MSIETSHGNSAAKRKSLDTNTVVEGGCRERGSRTARVGRGRFSDPYVAFLLMLLAVACGCEKEKVQGQSEPSLHPYIYVSVARDAHTSKATVTVTNRSSTDLAVEAFSGTGLPYRTVMDALEYNGQVPLLAPGQAISREIKGNLVIVRAEGYAPAAFELTDAQGTTVRPSDIVDEYYAALRPPSSWSRIGRSAGDAFRGFVLALLVAVIPWLIVWAITWFVRRKGDVTPSLAVLFLALLWIATILVGQRGSWIISAVVTAIMVWQGTRFIKTFNDSQSLEVGSGRGS